MRHASVRRRFYLGIVAAGSRAGHSRSGSCTESGGRQPSTSPSAKARRWRSRCRRIARRIAMDLQGGLWTLPIDGRRGAAHHRRVSTTRGSRRGRPTASASRSRAIATARGASGRSRRTARIATALTSGSFDDREPHWSPDGTRIAFSSDRSGNYDIWVLDVTTRPGDAGHEESCERLHADVVARWPGDRVRVDAHAVARRLRDDPAFAEATAGRPAERLLLVEAEGTVGTPSWTPDGKDVVYSVTSGGAARLMLGNAGARRRRRRTFRSARSGSRRPNSSTPPTARSNAAASLSDAGTTPAPSSTIAFTAPRSRADARRTTRARSATSTRRPRSRVLGIMHPRASRGRQAHRVCRAGRHLGDADCGGKPERVTNDAAVDTDAAWSPDGTQARVLVRSRRHGNMDIWTCAISKTGQDRRLTTSPRSRDGRHVVARRPVDRVHEQRRRSSRAKPTSSPPKAATPRKLLDRIFGPGFPSWSADGKSIIVSTLKPYSSALSRGHELHDGAAGRRRRSRG